MRSIKQILVVCLISLTLTIMPLVNAQGIPCVIRGTVTYNGSPVAGATVVASSGDSTTTGGDGSYGLDTLSGSTITVTATYNGHSRSIIVNTPSDGGMMIANTIAITFTPTPTPTPAPTPTSKPTATPIPTPTPAPGSTPTPAPVPATPTPAPAQAQTATPTPVQTETPALASTASATPTSAPAITATPAPGTSSATPTAGPTEAPGTATTKSPFPGIEVLAVIGLGAIYTLWRKKM
jgi:hypothetical protein